MDIYQCTPIYFNDCELASELVNLLGRGYSLNSKRGVIFAEKNSLWSSDDVEIEDVEAKPLSSYGERIDGKL